MPSLNIEEIQKILPHRYPFLMLDRVEELEPKKKVVAVKNVTINDGFFPGHFPERPVMPGVLIIEAMAQASIVLFYADESRAVQPTFYLCSVKARFLNPVFPGDQLRITVTPVKAVSGAAIVEAAVFVETKEVARAELGFSAK
jgi:3-hydroxyacyl-[acyl-carrier-protein] dehydratase